MPSSQLLVRMLDGRVACLDTPCSLTALQAHVWAREGIPPALQRLTCGTHELRSADDYITHVLFAESCAPIAGSGPMTVCRLT